MIKKFLTSESVTEGHPDKICDQISDGILDALLAKDPKSRVAIETLVTKGVVIIAGEITTRAYVEIPQIARDIIKSIGYTDPQYGFDYKSCGVEVIVHEQSPDIARGVSKKTKEDLTRLGAGDQGCIRKGTLVRTNKGFRPIQDIKIGDFVLTPHGFKKVLNSKKTGRKKLIEIRLSNGFALECTPGHKIFCYTKNGSTYWKEASKLDENDFICIIKPVNNNFSSNYIKSYIPREQFFTKYNHKIFGPEEIVLDDKIGYVLGELIGDGYVRDHRLMDLAFGTNRSRATVVQEIVSRQIPLQWRLIEHNGNISLKIDSVLVRKHFENMGLMHKKAPEKRTPRNIFISPPKVIKNYLCGLFDSDGTIIKNTGRNKNNIKIRLGSSSLQLLQETQLLLNDFGIKSTIIFNRPKGTKVGKLGRNNKIYKSKYDNYVLSLSGFESYQNFAKNIGFIDYRKHERLDDYLKNNRVKPPNSRGIFLIPHPTKDEFIDERRIGRTLPFSIARFKKKIIKSKSEVYDLEIKDVNIFSANGIFVHNSMFGYATNETSEYMPLPIVLAHKLTKQLAKVRKNKTLPYLRPDGKSQITVEYANGTPNIIKNIVIAAQHDKNISLEKLRKDIKKHVIDPIIPQNILNAHTKFFINATGRFVLGGPAADTGLTGRKIIVDTYGGIGSHGGGAFCVAGDSIINTEHGLGKIKELVHIKRGELIKTDISPAPIGQWVDNGEMDTLTIVTQDGYELEGTPTQRIRVIDSEGNYIWRHFDKLQSTDWIAIQKKNRLFGNGELPEFIFEHKPATHRKNSFSFPKNLNEDYSYLMGLLIGDGRCTTRDGVQVCVCEKQMEIIVQDLFKRLFGKKGKIFGHWAFFCGVELRAFLQHLGVDRLRSWHKQVPKSIWTAPKPVVAAFLRGLFDTDGTTRRTGRNKNSADITLSTTSKKLAKDVQQLLLNLGIISHIQTVDATGKKSRIRNRIILSSRPIYHLRIKGYASVNIFYKEINFALPRKAKILNDLMNEGWLKRNLLQLPNQHQRVKRLWDKLSSREHQKDPANIGRLLRSPVTKGTKDLTYEKLEEFLNSYENKFAGDTEFEYLRMLYIMNHYYTRMKSFKRGRTHVYDFTVPGVHTFTANGFVCHNSGKDPTKVDRSGSYGARWVAKNLVASGLCDNVEVQIAYSIGVSNPLSINIDTYGTGKLPDDKLITLVKRVFDLRPGMLIKNLKLRRPIYKQVAAYGHFGRNDLDLPWEKLNKVDELKKLAKTM